MQGLAIVSHVDGRVQPDTHFAGEKVRTIMSNKEGQVLIVPDNDRLKERHAKRRTILWILTVACLGIGLWLYGFGSMRSVPSAPPTAERTNTMYATKQNQVINRGIPPIDASATAKTETATFALG